MLSSPNTDKLFGIRKDDNDLDHENTKVFHRLVAKLLYISKRVRPDLAPAVHFLTTRGIKPPPRMIGKSSEMPLKISKKLMPPLSS